VRQGQSTTKHQKEEMPLMQRTEAVHEKKKENKKSKQGTNNKKKNNNNKKGASTITAAASPLLSTASTTSSYARCTTPLLTFSPLSLRCDCGVLCHSFFDTRTENMEDLFKHFPPLYRECHSRNLQV
jgi:hypothetical protein